jgi:cob(I)alamin adenosyltransferase
MSIYTRTGDLGETSLFGGKRVLKCDDIVNLYGLIDELNSSIGLVISMLSAVSAEEFLRDIQKDLFSIGSFLAGGSQLNVHELMKRVGEMEVRIDTMEKKLKPLHRFILPGGTPLASYIHLSRSVTRRVERKAVYVLKECHHPEIDIIQLEKVIQYLNRLSDFLFVLARLVNKEENMVEREWVGQKKK